LQEDIPQSLVGSDVGYMKRNRLNRNLVIVLFLLPSALLFLTFVIFPIFQGAYVSMFKWKGFGPPTDFVGFDNFTYLFNHKPFRQSLLHNFLIALMSITIQLPMALGLAMLVGRKMPGRAVFRAIFFVPYIISESITSVIWFFIFNPRFAASEVINSVLDFLIPFFEPGAWLGDPQKVLIAIFVVLTWKYFGLHMILYVAGLQQIPTDIEEAAAIDGANGLQTLWYVTIPMLSRTIVTTVYLSILGSFQLFDIVWLLTKGGPVNASEVITTYMYKNGFVSFRLGFGSSVAVILFLICLAFSLVYQRLFMRGEYAGVAD
jgi:raffinose/stachyose/melibiose transport system permease protein